tara:strand:- start:7464 stop:8249 length:786 start_codon:yes stop_codon:yes gene_type:complete
MTATRNALPSKKLLSIITIVKNDRDGFLRTAENVIAKKPDWCEWIVVDGASSDGTADTANKFRAEMDVFISEPDSGIASAFNKGVALSNGKYLLFLNAGDILTDSSYSMLEELHVRYGSAPVIVGRIKFGRRTVGRPVSFHEQFLRNRLPHQGMLVRRSLFRLLGPYDTRFKLGMDYEWSLRLKKRWKDIRFVDVVVTNMAEGGISISDYRGTFDAYAVARNKHCRFALVSSLISYLFIIRIYIANGVRDIFSRFKNAARP